MEYISPIDYEYIINKYHDTQKPFDPFSRFIRHDEIFDAATGMDGDALKSELLRRDEANSHLPHPIRKAKAFTFVLENTRISCDPRDRFPAINTMDRPLNATLIKAWKKEVFGEIIPEIEAKRATMERTGMATIYPDFDHSVPLWDRIFSLGFEGLLNESEAIRHSRPHTADEDAFFEGIKITYEAILAFIDRLAAQAEAAEGSERMAIALRSIRHHAPTTFYEALLTDYLYFIVCEHIEGLQVRSLSNFDRLFFPYYQNDLKNGVTEQEIREDLAYFFLQFTAIGNYWNQPVYLGGTDADGKSRINELSYLFLDVYDHMRIYSPKVQIKLAKNTPKSFVLKALDMIRRGNNSIVFVCEETIRQALVRFGATEEQARMCDVRGCYEYSTQGTYVSSMNYVNLLKPLEYALHEGRDGVTAEQVSIASPNPQSYESFEELYEEYRRQLKYCIDQVIHVVNGFEGYLSYINPQSMLSATYPSCLQKAKDAIRGGSIMNPTDLNCGFLADIADSLTMIKKYVFDQKLLTLPELIEMLDNNFEENEPFRLRLLADREKYGNNQARPDQFATEIVEFICKNVVGRPNATERDGVWFCSFHVARQSYSQGRKTAASPNGRRLGEELSKNVSASMGQNREGATAAILSATKIDATTFPGDAALDLGLHPSAVKGEDGLNAMYALLLTFANRGGHALHINVFDADTLRDAQANPEKYQDLQIRVCGWNVLFNTINKVEQDGFIRQAEALQ